MRLNKNNLSFYHYVVLVFFLLNLITIRFVEVRVSDTNLLLIEPFFLVLVIFYIFNKLTSKKFKANRKFFRYFLAFAIYGLLSVFYSYFFVHNEAPSIFGKFRQICVYPFIFFISYESFKSETMFYKLHNIFKLAVILYVPLALISYILGLNIFEQHGYFQLFYHWEGWIASYLFFYYLIKFLISHKIEISSVFYVLLSIIIMILTARRGLWLSVFLTFFIIYILSKYRIKFKNNLRLLSAGILLFFIVFVITPSDNAQGTDIINNLVEEISHRFSDMLTNLDSPNSLQYGGTAYLRMVRYQEGINTFLQYPILGKGIGYKTQFMIPGNRSWYYVQSLFHNAYLEILVSMGGIGLLLFLLIHFNIVRFILNKYKRLGDKNFLLVMSILGLYFTGMLWSLLDNTFVANSNFIFTIYFLLGATTRLLLNDA